MITETFCYSGYEVVTRAPSKIDPAATVITSRKVKCPKCRMEREEIYHGKTVRCGCGLEMTRHGNALMCRLR